MSIDTLQAAETAEIIVLSAPGVDALRGAAWQLLGQLRAFANGAPTEPFTLSDLAYTLKSCRDASTCRAAFVVRRLDDLAAGLEHYLRARDEADAIVPRSVTAGRHGELVTILRGDVAADAGAARLLAGAAAQTMARALWASRDLENVALIWVRGGRLDWDALRDGPPPRRLAWLDEAPPESGAPPCAGDALAVPAVSAAGIEPGLAAIWQALFDLPAIGRHQDFFALGGDSQLGLRMLAQVRERHGIDLPLRYLYEAPTIARMSETIVRLAALAPSAGNDDATEYEEGFIR
ncbi:phosphopantetheine-binding protein [Burkholderia ubonensis]|uniref:phosphopantetheine-binding protein n=1 Tax=Burkholderia ubonensis TaxID=101571 RepID=UPI002AB32646|nr:phosphopantetheine-binding protein [Burkholderia ubonensis]